MPRFSENPGAAYAAPANHNGIHAILFETLFADFGGSNIAIADDGNLYAGIVFCFAD
jgi:hypothetical protein